MEVLVVLATCVEVGTLVCNIVQGGNEFFKKVKPLLKLLPVVGDVLRQFDSDGVLSTDERADILERISRLEQSTNDVVRDINEKIEWQTMKLQYSPAIERIKLGMEYLLGGYCSDPNRADEAEDEKHKREIFKSKLKSLCANEKTRRDGASRNPPPHVGGYMVEAGKQGAENVLCHGAKVVKDGDDWLGEVVK